MINDKKAISSLITNNFLGEALNCHFYINKKNPKIKHYLFTIGKLKIENIKYLKSYKNIIHIPTESLFTKNEYEDLVRRYTPLELSCALRATCHRYIFEKTSIQQWLMIDTDIVIMGSLDEIFNEFMNYQIFLISHNSNPSNEIDIIRNGELNFLKYGLYNGGVLGFKRGESSHKAILWLENRLLNFSENSGRRLLDNIKNKYDFLFLDQLWLNLLPIYFKNCKISFDQRFNLGHWNLWEIFLTVDQEVNYFCDDKPLIAFHFSGLPIKNLTQVSIHNKIYLRKPNKIWAEAARNYLLNLKKIQNKLIKEFYFYRKYMPRKSIEMYLYKYFKRLIKLIFINLNS